MLFRSEETLFSGYAPDGGLFVPESIPCLTPDALHAWSKAMLSYAQVLTNIVRLYVSEPELCKEELDTCVHALVTKVRHPEVVHVQPMNLADGTRVSVAELFHGPTASFKDLGLSLVTALMECFLARRRQGGHATLLVATTGDTGNAAIEAVRGSSRLDVIVLYPKDRVSRMQQMHMCSVQDANVHVYEVEATNDELEVPIAQLTQEALQRESAEGPKLDKQKQVIMSVNSINWARVMVHLAHHVYLYLRHRAEAGEDQDNVMDVVIPTGAAGNLAAAVYAHRMGLPIRVHVATNANDCLVQLLTDGLLDLSREARVTVASAMDVA